jgi:tRNA dimethylallyltransferase
MLDQTVVFIAGPTASGKTELAMQLADRHEVQLINVDAAQVYRGMDIGTAKLDAQALKRYPHALMNIRQPNEVYDAAQFVNDASELIEQAQTAGKLPVLVGGSMFYFSALENGVSKLPQANEIIRQQIELQAVKIGWQSLYQRLESIDPKICQTIKAQDKQRIQRALEIHQITGQIPSEMMARDKPRGLAKPILKFNLYTPDRKLLHKRIAKRFDVMLESGLIEEVKALKARQELHADLPSMRCVGYRQVWQYLDDEFDYEAMKEKGIAATRQLAKRQLTWLRQQRGQIWLSSEFENNVELIAPFLS